MARLYKFANQLRKLVVPTSLHTRNISLTPVTRVKEIVEKQQGNTVIIEGKLLPEKNEHLLLKLNQNGSCPVCSTGLDVKHTDVLILRQFLRSDGCMLPRRVTGLCSVQQKRITTLVAMAQKAGLMPNIAPAKSNMDPSKRFKWRKYNTYFDETTIKVGYF